MSRVSFVRLNRVRWTHGLILGLLLTGTSQAQAADALHGELLQIEHGWAQINYQTPEKDRTAAFDKLAKQAHALSQRFPQRAEPLVWESIVLSSHAGSLSGLAKMGALDEVKKARDLLFAAEKIDPEVLNGSVYTSLGTLYYKVPGWPFGFGSNSKARTYLEKALAINPNGIDPNYFYGELLFEQREYAAAMKALQKAKQAPPRPDQALADRGRHKQVDDLIAEVKHYL